MISMILKESPSCHSAATEAEMGAATTAAGTGCTAALVLAAD